MAIINLSAVEQRDESYEIAGQGAQLKIVSFVV